MPEHTLTNKLTQGHLITSNGDIFTKAEEIIFTDADTGSYYSLVLDKGELTFVLMDPQPTFI